ncbi:leucine efflux protein LeuE [Streptomyces sp. P38-E01]|uniref:Leucine efflux protein LeuE n=1 Tax=Streptomyces tardus TaxID=2780544 RepID=A0A949JPZ3_9ACTN|nr:leucine efflux protein LeuE [Streptomyces tardus]MBU7598120.1 leucine efflux protein LeuE [Streptomyces tardus]
MLGITDLPTYLVGLALIVLLPGPNSLYVVSVAARRGVRPGYQAACGVFCGDAVLMTLSAGGVASLLQASPLAFSVVKYLGAGYLSWLAVGLLRGTWQLWRRRTEPPEPGADTGPDTGRTEPAAAGTRARGPARELPFRRALLASLLNPKAILFFVSFFVQFVDPAYPYPALTFVVLGLWAQLFSFAYLSLLIFGGTRLAAAFRSRRRLQAGASAAAGTAFLGFAAKLSLTSG